MSFYYRMKTTMTVCSSALFLVVVAIVAFSLASVSRQDRQEMCVNEVQNSSAVPFCGSAIKWPIFNFPSVQLEELDLKAHSLFDKYYQVAISDRNCKRFLTVVLCANTFRKCEQNGDSLLQPCFSDCETVRYFCNVTLTDNCTPEAATTCNTVTAARPGALAIVIIVFAISYIAVVSAGLACSALIYTYNKHRRGYNPL